MRLSPPSLRRITVFAGVLSAVIGVSVTTAGSADAAKAAATAPVDKAWQWVLGQSGSGTPLASRSTISATQTYPADWTGPVSGTFQPRGASAPVVDPAAVVVDDPATVPPDFAGVLSGHITLPPQANRWIVQAYRDTSAGRVQVPVQALVDPQGEFTIDLSGGSPPDGTWALGLLDASAGYAPTGVAWPAAPVYDGWVVRALVVTDTAYPVGEQPARADGTFAFADSRPGAKVFQLVRTADDAVLAEAAPDTGLLRSYAGSTRCYAYDQALGVLAGLAMGADVHSLVTGLIALQAGDGGFLDSADVRNPAAGVRVERTGVSAVATYALLRALAASASTDPSRPAIDSAARAGVAWLLAQQRPDGLVGAGVGDYRADGSVDPTAVPAQVSTEHNLDTWQTLRYAAGELGDASLATAADQLGAAVVASLWNTSTGRFREGLAPDGTPDDTDPLDVNSWGSLFLRSYGRGDLADQALAHVSAFASSAKSHDGYRAYYPQPAFPSAKANVWVEGSAGVALARARAGDAAGAANDLSDVAALQRGNGSFPYALVADSATSMTSAQSVAATAWFILASSAGDGPTIWD